MKKWEIIETCKGQSDFGGCGRKVFVQQSDLGVLTDFRKKEKVIIFKCPYCGDNTDIDSKKIPKELQKKLGFD